MNLNKNILLAITIFAVYLIHSWSGLSLNPLQWSEMSRLIFTYAIITITSASGLRKEKDYHSGQTPEGL
jgi:hypothetical protein